MDLFLSVRVFLSLDLNLGWVWSVSGLVLRLWLYLVYICIQKYAIASAVPKPSPRGEGGPRQRWMRGAMTSAPRRLRTAPASRRRGWRPRQPSHAGLKNRSMTGEYAILKTGCRGASRSARAARTEMPAAPRRTRTISSPVIANRRARRCGNPSSFPSGSKKAAWSRKYDSRQNNLQLLMRHYRYAATQP